MTFTEREEQDLSTASAGSGEFQVRVMCLERVVCVAMVRLALTKFLRETDMSDGIKALLVLAMSVIHCADAIAQVSRDQQREFDLSIERMRMSAALHEISEQSGFNVGWFPESEAEEQMLIGPLHGRFTAERALERLLVGTEFTYEWLNSSSLYVSRKRQGASPAPTQDPTATSQSNRNRRPVESGNVIVIASKLDIDATFPSTMQLHTETIESYGVSTLAELLSYVPQIPTMRAVGSRVTGEQYADLRGFGAGTTIILVNGRRVGATATSFDSSAFDLNSIPLPAVKQVEIFLDAHPIAYGVDAMGGAINIVLKDEMPEPIVQAKYGAADGGAEEARGSLGFGISTERFRAGATLDYFHRRFLLGSERDLTSNQDFRRFGGMDMRSADASPPNISSLVPGRNLPGLNSPFAAVPSGGSNLTIAEFNAGQRNLISANRFLSIVPQTKRASGIGSMRWQLTEHVDLFSEILFVDRTGAFQFGPPAVRGGMAPAANPYNPFGESVLVNALITDAVATTYLTEISLLRGVLGASAAINDWSVQAWTVWHEEDARTWRENELDPTKVMQALSATSLDGALNFFQDGPPGSAALLRSLRADRLVDHFESEYLQIHFGVQGPMFEVPAGKVRLLLGAEWQREGLSTPPNPPRPAFHSQYRMTVDAFGEVRVPVVSPDMQWSAANAIDLSLSLRGDHGDFGTGLGAQYLVEWQPVSTVQTSAFYRDFYRQPNLYDLYTPSVLLGRTRLPDPRRNNELSLFAIISGGSDSLVPTVGQGWGGRIEYEASDGLSFSVGYWHTSIEDRIAYLPFTYVLAHESRFPALVVRADPTPQELALGMPGALVSVIVVPGNYGDLQADGIDVGVKGLVITHFGRLTSTLTATWNHSYTTNLGSGLKPEQRVGIANGAGTIPRWRSVMSVGWERAAWSVSGAARFVSEYDDASLGGARNGRSVPESIQIDAQASIRLTKMFQGLKLTIGATNIFDAEPAYAEVFGVSGYDPTQADLRQRFWYLGAEKSF